MAYHDYDPRQDETGGSEEMPISLRTQTVPGTENPFLSGLDPDRDVPLEAEGPIWNNFLGDAPDEKFVVKEGESATEQFTTGSRRAKMPPVRFDLLPPAAVERLARTYDEGAKKYGDWNWRKGQPYSSVLNHLLAHIFKFMAREDQAPFDEDHLAHAAWGLMALMQFEATPAKYILDDRYGCPGWVTDDMECDRDPAGDIVCAFHQEQRRG